MGMSPGQRGVEKERGEVVVLSVSPFWIKSGTHWGEREMVPAEEEGHVGTQMTLAEWFHIKVKQLLLLYPYHPRPN